MLFYYISNNNLNGSMIYMDQYGLISVFQIFQFLNEYITLIPKILQEYTNHQSWGQLYEVSICWVLNAILDHTIVGFIAK